MRDEDVADDADIDAASGMKNDFASVDGVVLSFKIRGRLGADTFPAPRSDAANLPRTHQEMLQSDTRSALDRTAVFQGALTQEFPGQPFEAVFNPPSYDTTGPIGYIAGIVALILPGTQVGHAAELVALADGTVELLDWLAKNDADIERVDDGIAFLTAWAAIRNEHPDLTLLFVNEVRPLEQEFDWEVDGYMVGFRDERTSYLVAVAVDGVPGPVVSVPLDVYRDRSAIREAKQDAEMAAELAAYQREYPEE